MGSPNRDDGKRWWRMRIPLWRCRAHRAPRVYDAGMLERLTIRDLVLVERAEIVLGAGLNALTGETGAGKSLLVQAASLLVGERADSDVVREGAESAVVEGEFR